MGGIGMGLIGLRIRCHVVGAFIRQIEPGQECMVDKIGLIMRVAMT